PSAPAAPTACSTEMCNRTAKFIADSLDSRLNPCEDFYQFTCGGFNAKRTIPEDKLALSPWLLPPASINAIYFYYDNSITIPAGFLKFPTFSAERNESFALNYGVIGSFIGHEITHGFDDTGRKFDAVGNLHNWWSNASEAGYLTRAQCFVKQYGDIVEPETGLHLNGKNGLGENIADNGGAHVSFEAFKARHLRSPSARLAALPQYTPEQLFFLIWGT
ncbi:PREDICTED: neprilysin-11-like, partial [Rhagoletis zephyria]|uniref:neprilysin-11-like n=1 Tax=Rhagoletis zephyria TaxID=28612 RepID=UPI00081135FD